MKRDALVVPGQLRKRYYGDSVDSWLQACCQLAKAQAFIAETTMRRGILLLRKNVRVVRYFVHDGALLAKGKQEHERYSEKYATQHSCKFSRNLHKTDRGQASHTFVTLKKQKAAKAAFVSASLIS